MSNKGGRVSPDYLADIAPEYADTINKICDALEIPVSYLLFFSITEEDIPEEKKSIFNALKEPIQKILVDD